MKIRSSNHKALGLLGGLFLLALVCAPGFAEDSQKPLDINGSGRIVAAERALARETGAALVSMKLRGTDIREALRLLARQGGVNIVLSDKVAGTVTLDLDNATVSQALDAIIEVNGFVSQTMGDLVLVTTLEEMEKKRIPIPDIEKTEVLVLNLKYADARRMVEFVKPMLTPLGKIGILPDSDEGAEHTNSNYQGGAASSDGGEELAINGNGTSTSAGKPARSKVLVVVDDPTRLDTIEREVKKLDVKPVQFIIEARFVEVTLTGDYKLGVDWNAVFLAAGAAAAHTAPFGGSSLGEFNPHTLGAPQGIFPAAPGDLSVGDEVGSFALGTLDFTAFTAVLRMIQETAKINLVSYPSIRVKENTTASILVGERYPIFSGDTTDQGTFNEVLDRYEPIGVQLEVTPSLMENGEIELIVRPASSTLGPLVEGSTISAIRIITKRLDTTVTAKNKQTIVLGGLVSERKAEVINKVPFVSSIPLFGELFTHTSNETEKVELAIFLTVTNVNADTISDKHRKFFEKNDPEAEVEDNPTPSKLDFTTGKAAY